MKCIRVHRARRQRHVVRTVRGLGIALSVAAASRVATAQQPPYPQPYPGYPAPPQSPQYPQHPQPPYPQAPQYPQLPGPGIPGQPQHPQHPLHQGVLAAYRIPILALAQPADGVVLPDDKPVVVFRFVQAEPLDPIDALSFTVSVDGIDRTGLFTLTNGEAWGPLAPATELLTPGQHEVRARICSARGACGVAKGTVTVVAGRSMLDPAGPSASSSASASAASAEKRQRRARILDAVLQAARVLIRQ